MASIAAKRRRNPPRGTKKPVPKNAHNWVRGLGKTFARVALFQVDGTLARVVAVKGLPRGPVGDSISLLDQTPLRWAVEAASPIVGAGRSPGAMIIPVTLGVPTPRAFAVIPVVVDRKLIALAYIDNGIKAFGVNNVSELFDFCSQLLARKRKIVKPRSGIRSTVRRTGVSRFRIPGLQRHGRPHSGTLEPHGINFIRLDESGVSDASHSETIGHTIVDALRHLAQDPDTQPGIAGSVFEAAAPPIFSREKDVHPRMVSVSAQPFGSPAGILHQPSPAKAASNHQPAKTDISLGRSSGQAKLPASVPACAIPPEPSLGPAAIEALAASIAQETLEDIQPAPKIPTANTGLPLDSPPCDGAQDKPFDAAQNRSFRVAQKRPFSPAQNGPLVPGADRFETPPPNPPPPFDRAQVRPFDTTQEWPFDVAQATPFATVPEGTLTGPPANLVVTPHGIRSTSEAARARKAFNWRRLATALSAGLILLLISGLVAMAPTSEVAGNRMIEILPHSTLSEIAEQLHKEQLIRSSKGFCMLARLTGVDRRLRAGTYRLPTGVWAWTVLGELHSGQVHTKTVTIPEGYTLREIASLMERTGLVSSARLIKEARNPELLRRYGIPASSAEGYLFPETYTVAEGTSERDILATILKQFFARLRSLPAAEGLTREAVFDRLILASIVEREARVPEERHRIAGVFQNRMDRNMRLESCATVQYILQRPKARLRHADLRIQSPYNTYLNEGLPPGPISNPGLEAIAAALAPEKHEYLFFVARDDGTNRHIFTKSYTAHEAVLARLRKRR